MEEIANCIECGEEISSDAIICEVCEDPCPYCGKQLLAKWSGVACPDLICGYTFCF